MNILEYHLNKNNAVSVSTEVKQDNIQVEQKVETKKDGKKLLFAGAVAAAAIGGAVVLMSKGKAKPSDVQKAGKKAVQEIANNIPQKANNVADDVAEVVTGQTEKITTAVAEQVDEVVQNVMPKIKDVKFNKGIAFKDGEKFTGIIEDTLKSGKKVVLEYKDGVIQKSTNNGIEKVFDHKAIKKISEEAKAQHDKLNKLLSNKDDLSLEDFTKQVDDIKFKSKNDLAKIDEIKTSKLKVLEEVKEKAFIEFKNSIENMSDGELEKVYDEISLSKKKLWLKAQELAEEKRIVNLQECNILGTLSKSEKQEYALLERKLGAISSQKKNRGYSYINKILCKPEDKKILTKHSSAYITDIEYVELQKYYDDYSCNDAYRGLRAQMSVNEEIMNGLFAKAPALEEEAVVYRAVNSARKSDQAFIDSFKNGFVIENPGYTSTATIIDKQFYQFAGSVVQKTEDGVLMRIRLPKGTKGVLGGHNEFLLPRNSQIKVNCMNLFDGIKVADCEYILPKN